ncbi:hypothetical protein MPD5_1671 (plasmid) [Melissococcus plutonius DAT561]|nr:hypothetical protein MPD5_1671 [Melissococcus plutonius DAT561]
MNVLIIITIICCFISFAFFITSFIKFDLFYTKKRKIFARYYSLTSNKEIKQKQKEILNENSNGTFDLKKKYRFISFVHKIMILSILVNILCLGLYFYSIWNLSILFILSIELFLSFNCFFIYFFISKNKLFTLFRY